MPEKFDVIVVGAGPAGITAALALSREGFKVAIFERGEQAGSKNMFGGMLYYTEILHKLVPGFWDEAPIERYVTQHGLIFTTETSSTSLLFSEKQFAHPPYNGITLLRSKFDPWYARKARETGALFVPETLVNDLVYDGKKVIGVQTARENGVVYGDVVVISEGANSLLVEKAKLGKESRPRDFAVAAKEIVALPRAVIQERFNLEGDEGVSYSFVGDCIRGMEGGGFLFTNQNSLSIGVVARLSSLERQKESISEVLEVFKAHPIVRPLIADGILKEYSGHLIPEGGLKTSPRLFGDGVLVVGDAARFLWSTGLTLQGMNFAIASGFAAAEAIQKARERNDYSEKSLAQYPSFLEKSFVLPTLKEFKKTPGFMENPRIYTIYPSIMCGVMRKILKGGDHPRKKFLKVAISEIRAKSTLRSLIADLISGGRALLW